MIKNVAIVSAVAFGSMLGSIASAQIVDESDEAATEPDTSVEVICRRTAPPTGSRIGGRNICHTIAEWAAMDAEARMALRNANASSSFVNGGRPEVGISNVTGEPAN